MLLVSAALFGFSADALSLDSPDLDRRSALQQSLASIAPAMVAASVLESTMPANASPLLGAYQVFPDASPKLDPKIKSIKENKLISSLSKKVGTVWLGEHHNAEGDHLLQVDLLRKLHASQRRNNILTRGAKSHNMAVGLEQVQVQFQPVLDAYVKGELSTEEMRSGVEWDKRWSWSFEGYRPVLELARDLKIPLIALNVDSEDMLRVAAGGFANLPPENRAKYIQDPEGFASFAKPRCFKCYVEYCILSSFDMHEKLGLLQYTMSGEKLEEPMNFMKFFSGRMLWDEAMASRAYRWTKENPGGLMVGLVGADHVKFGNGIPGRYDRMVGKTRDCVSMMLNPSLIDTQPSGSVSMAQNSYDPNELTLQLLYSKEGVDATTDDRFQIENIGGSLPLADYILTSKT